jgi:hypothetical protein
VLFHRQRADIFSQLCAMRADVMHGQHIKHCGYTPDMRIRLNNPRTVGCSPRWPPDLLLLWVSAQSLSFAILALTLFRASLFHGFFAAADAFGQQIAQFLKACSAASRAAAAARHA